MITLHALEKLQSRGLKYTSFDLELLAGRCRVDTAICLEKLNSGVSVRNSPDNREDSRTNGELVILIVRHRTPITIFLRRENQPLEPGALDVQNIINLVR